MSRWNQSRPVEGTAASFVDPAWPARSALSVDGGRYVECGPRWEDTWRAGSSAAEQGTFPAERCGAERGNVSVTATVIGCTGRFTQDWGLGISQYACLTPCGV